MHAIIAWLRGCALPCCTLLVLYDCLAEEQQEEHLAWEYLSTCVTDPAVAQDIASWEGKVPEVPGIAPPPRDAIAEAVVRYADSPIATVVEV